ncbi:hypothetical protein BRC90_11085 [Halobacteriales archaeon QS_4_69_34]|nr:MAG: hypothetical protein BRC90_11085 [Halobacteriales archaeon QS_4_69_34]
MSWLEPRASIEPIGLLLIVLAVRSIVWGFDRYRRRFVKADLLVGLGVAGGLLTIVFVPMIYDRVGSLLDLQQRVVTISVLSNVALLVGVLYLLPKVHICKGSEILARHLQEGVPE